MLLTRRRVLVSGLAAATVSTAHSQTYPARPVTIVVGYAAGGGVDAVVRTLSVPLSARLGQPVVVDNRPGASGTIAATHVARGAADGHVLFGTDGGALALNGALFSKLAYDPVRDFAPVSLIIRAPLLVVAHPSFPASDLKGLIDYAQRAGGSLSYASPGLGTYHHLGMELLKSRAGFQAQDIQYKGAAQAVQDVISGQVPVMPLDSIVALPQLRSGKLKALVAFTQKRLVQLPEVPTAAESGFSELDVYPWVGLVAPGATPPPIVSRLATELRAIIASKEVSDRFIGLGMEPYSTSPEQFASFIRSEIVRWHPLIEKLGIKLS
jgi:tripartite-type tricarboxylate transporter receptor subunit TctC